MKKVVAVMLSLCFANAFSQANFLQWANSVGSSTVDTYQSVVTDTLGNVYATGSFTGTVDFDPGSGVFNLTSTFTWSPDMFIAKYDPLGNFVWAGAFTGAYANSIAIDKKGQLYATGSFSGTADFNPGPASYNLTSTGSSSDPFVLKLSNNGGFIWAKQFVQTGSGFNTSYGTGIKVDNNGNVISCGVFHGTYDFNPGAASVVINANTTFMGDSYVSKLDSLGNYVWIRGFTTVTSTEYNLKSIDLDNAGNIYVGGVYYSQFNTAFSDQFLAKLDPAGTTIWTKQITQSSSPNQSDEIRSVSVDAFNNMFVTGFFSGTINFNTNGGTYNQTGAGYDIFISKYNTFGNWLWTKVITGANNHDQGYAVQANEDGTVFCTGEFLSTSVDFDPGTAAHTVNVVGGKDAFIVKLDAAGDFMWAKTFGSVGDETGTALCTDTEGNIFMAGNFNGMTDFDPDAGVYNLSANGGTDGFLLKLTNCIYNAPDICLVTVDSLADNNVIYWDKAMYPLADSFIVYRYDALSTNYLPIGSVAMSDPNNFLIDTARNVAGPNGGNPQYSSYKYKMAIRGACGDLGTLGLYHESIFIQQNSQNFSWNAYAIEGQSSPASGYQFLRDNNNTGTWQVLVNTGGLSTTDPNYASYPNGNWRVDALGFSCMSTARLNGSNQAMGAINTSRSNIKSPTSTIGIQTNKSVLKVDVYPVPANESITIDIAGLSSEATICIENVLGQFVYTTNSIQKRTVIDCSHMEAGVYFISIQSANGQATRKVIIQ
jgi:hypothetical protein